MKHKYNVRCSWLSVCGRETEYIRNKDRNQRIRQAIKRHGNGKGKVTGKVKGKGERECCVVMFEGRVVSHM